MVKYYFFRVCREVNAQRQRRTVLHPLPGQTTYDTARNPDSPIDTSYKVQLSNSENGKVVRLPSGTVVGVAHEGALRREVKLNVYSRNDQKFYRTEREVFLVDGLALTSNIRTADDCNGMLEAYRRLIDRDGDSETSPSEPEHTVRQQAEPAGGQDDVPTTNVTRIDTVELDSIESSLLDSCSERDALGKLLVISQIRDRMRVGVTKFSYTKQNGEHRVAYGTRCARIIGQLGGELHEEHQPSSHDGAHYHYFDVQRCAWRNFCTEDVQGVSSDMPITSMTTIREIAARPVC